MDERKDDDRPDEHVTGVPLNLHPAHGEKLRLLPRMGEPLCIVEWLSQTTLKAIAYLPVYIAIIATLTLLAIVFGVPFTAR